jgi:hypothetical protein
MDPLGIENGWAMKALLTSTTAIAIRANIVLRRRGRFDASALLRGAGIVGALAGFAREEAGTAAVAAIRPDLAAAISGES